MRDLVEDQWIVVVYTTGNGKPEEKLEKERGVGVKRTEEEE